MDAGSGSAFWHLALKNWVIASGIRPRMVLIFFRDANLTDVMFRLDEQFRWALDLAAAGCCSETELAAIVRDLRLSPFGVSELDRQTGTHLFLLALGYSVPLWIQSL